MYGLYERLNIGNCLIYKFIERTSLFGCNQGYIPYLLRKNLNNDQNEPFKWHMNIEYEFSKDGMKNKTLIIDLKPNNSDGNLSLYEILDVWGVSESNWTPIMFRLRGLFIDKNSKEIDDKNFSRNKEDIDEPIFSMLYLNGSVKDGQLIGRWTAPRASPTNSALLWPKTFEFFSSQAQKFIAEALYGEAASGGGVSA